MEAEGSLPLSKVPAICPNPDPDESSPIRPSHFMWIHLNIILLSMSRSFNCLFSLRVFHQNPVYTSPLPHTYPAHLRLLNLVTWLIFGQEYRSLSFSLRSFLHSPVNLSLLGPSMLLSKNWCAPLNFKPPYFIWTPSTAYSKAKLKSNGDKAFACFKQFLIGNMKDQFSHLYRASCYYQSFFITNRCTRELFLKEYQNLH